MKLNQYATLLCLVGTFATFAETPFDKRQWLGVWQAQNSRGESITLTIPYVAGKQMPFTLTDKNDDNPLQGVAVYRENLPKANYQMFQDAPYSSEKLGLNIEPKDCRLAFSRHDTTIEVQATADNQDCSSWTESLTFTQNTAESEKIKPQVKDYAEVAYQGKVGDLPVYVVLGAKKSWYMYEKYKNTIELITDKEKPTVYYETYYDTKTDSRQRGGKLIFPHVVDVNHAPQTLRGNWQLGDKDLLVELHKVYPLAKQKQQSIRLPMTCDKFYYTATIDYQPNRVEQNLQRINIVQKSDNASLKSLSDALIYRSGADVFVSDNDCQRITALSKNTGYAVTYVFDKEKDKYLQDFEYAYIMDKLTDANLIKWQDWATDSKKKANAVYSDQEVSTGGEFITLTSSEPKQANKKSFSIETGVSYYAGGFSYQLINRMGIEVDTYAIAYRSNQITESHYDVKSGITTYTTQPFDDADEDANDTADKNKSMPYQYIKKYRSGKLILNKAVWNYPKSSYQLSANGTVLQKWTGDESLVDLHAKPFAKVNRIADDAFVDAITLSTLILNKNFKAKPNEKRIGLDNPDARIDFAFSD